VAVIEQDTWTRESWTDRGDPADALAAFAGWHPQVRAILEAVDETFIWALFDRTPLERWSAGRVTLLGDACHAMLPFMAQGAAQAIEDAATLASCLASAGSDLPSALHRYEILRIPRASRLQAMSTANKKRFHLADGPEQRERDAEMSAGSTDWSFGAVAWIYEHDASGVVLPPRVKQRFRNRPGTGPGIIEIWKPSGFRSSACASLSTCITRGPAAPGRQPSWPPMLPSRTFWPNAPP
jgi:salicylate hydroxylase